MGFSGAGVIPISRFVAVPRVTYLLDTFTDANGTAIAAHIPEIMPIGASWANLTGSIDIQNNRANPAVSVGLLAQATISTGTSDFVATADLVTGAGGTFEAVGLLFRMTDANNLWQTRLSRSTNSFDLFEHNAGVITARGSVAFTPTTITTYRLYLSVEGPTIFASINEIISLIYNGATLNQTVANIGPRFVNDVLITNAAVDNLLVIK